MTSGFAIGWRQVGACLVLMAAAAMVTSAYSVLAVPLSAEFNPSRMVLMLTMTVFMLSSGLMSPVFGGLMDRLPLRSLMALGGAALIAGLVALSFATSFIHVVIAYGLLLAPANILIGPMPATILVARWFAARRGTAIGIALTGVSLAGFIYPPIIQALLDHNEWRDAVRILAVIVALTIVPSLLMIVDRPSDKGLHPDGAASDGQAGQQGGAMAGADLPLRALLADGTFWILAAVFAVAMAGMTGMVTNLVPLAVDEGIDASLATFLISIFAGASLLAKLVFAAVADRLPLRVLMAVSILGFAAGMACMIGAEIGFWVIALGCGLIGLFGGLMVPLQGLLVPRIFGPHVVGRVIGILNFVILIALLATPPLFGLVFDVTGNYDAAFLTVAVLTLGTLLLVPYIRLQPPVPKADEARAGLA